MMKPVNRDIVKFIRAKKAVIDGIDFIQKVEQVTSIWEPGLLHEPKI